jgi:hypothetical protein
MKIRRFRNDEATETLRQLRDNNEIKQIPEDFFFCSSLKLRC